MCLPISNLLNLSLGYHLHVLTKHTFLNRHMNENGSSFSQVLVCHYFCLFWKYHTALFFPLGLPPRSPFLSSGLGQLSPPSFLKSYTNRGKRLLHVSIGHTGHLGLVLAPDFFFLIQQMERERQLFLGQGCPAVGVVLLGQSLALESRPWEAATGNAEGNKSVRLIFLSVLQWSCCCFLSPPPGRQPNFPVTSMKPLTRNSEGAGGGSSGEWTVFTFWPKHSIFSNHADEGKFRFS